MHDIKFQISLRELGKSENLGSCSIPGFLLFYIFVIKFVVTLNLFYRMIFYILYLSTYLLSFFEAIFKFYSVTTNANPPFVSHPVSAFNNLTFLIYLHFLFTFVLVFDLFSHFKYLFKKYDNNYAYLFLCNPHLRLFKYILQLTSISK